MADNFTIPAFEEVHTPKEAAARLKVSESFLAKKRVNGGGPKYTKVGRVVRYPESALHEYLSAQLRTSTSDLGPDAAGDEPGNVGAQERPTSTQRDHSKRRRRQMVRHVTLE
jgi:excisionase family DNA binding protein